MAYTGRLMVGLRRRTRRRKRRSAPRKSRAKPKSGWSLAQLASLSGTTPRNIRAYLQRQIIPRSPFRGSATRYDRRQLLWLLAIRRLRATEQLELTEIRKRLQSLSPADLEALATQGIASGALADALGLRPAPPPAEVPPPAQALLAQLPSWRRLELALGLELQIRDDASPQTLDLFRRIRALCAG